MNVATAMMALGLAVQPVTVPTLASTGGGLGGILSNKMACQNGFTYVSGVGYRGEVTAIQISNTRRFLTRSFLLSLFSYQHGQDDHNAAAMLFLPNGDFFAMGADHDSNNTAWWWRTGRFGADGKLERLDPLQIFDTGTKKNLSYGQAFIHESTGDIYVFFRTDTTNWNGFRSQNNAVSFTDLGLILDSSASGVVRTYINMGWAGADVLRFMIWQDPDTPTSHTVLQIADYNVVTGEITSGSGVVGTIGTGALRTSCSTIWDYGANTQVVGNSMAPGGKGILASPSVSGDTTHPRYFLKLVDEDHPYAAASWSKNHVVDSNTAGSFTISGLSTEDAPRIGVVRFEGNNFIIETYVSDVDAVNWTMAKTVATVPKTSTNFAVKSLLSCQGCDSEVEWVWIEGRYIDYNNYQDDLRPNWVH